MPLVPSIAPLKRCTPMTDGFEESYCCECGNPSDDEICERCKSETIDWNKQDRRWNGKPFWQESTQPLEYKIPGRDE